MRWYNTPCSNEKEVVGVRRVFDDLARMQRGFDYHLNQAMSISRGVAEMHAMMVNKMADTLLALEKAGNPED